MTERAVVLLETSGNQRFIFATNRLRENVGASEQVYRACRVRLIEALRRPELGRSKLPTDGAALADALLDLDTNPPIENGAAPFEVVVAGSGIATVLAASRDHGVRLVDAVTRRALTESPGLGVRGAVEPYDTDRDTSLRDAARRARRRLAEIRAELPPPAARHLRLPIVAECATSGLPAQRLDPDRDQPGRDLPRSTVSLLKHNAAQEGLDRQRALLPAAIRDSIPRHAEELENLLEQGVRWLGVLHADGNGMGSRFDRLATSAGMDDRAYIHRLRALSLAVDRCALEAFWAAAGTLRARAEKAQPDARRMPLLPLILGGDDITLLLDGREAIAFARDLLEALETVSRDRLAGTDLRDRTREALREALDRELEPGRHLTASAGVAVVKPHFPFHAAYELAHELRGEAKTTREHAGVECSSLSFHLLYDSAEYRLAPLRDRMEAAGDRLHARPYAVGRDLPEGPWLERHSIERLADRIHHVRSAGVARSALATLREAALRGRAAADDAFARLLAVRPEASGLAGLAASGTSLFWEEDGAYVSDLLDLFDAGEVWTPEEEAAETVR